MSNAMQMMSGGLIPAMPVQSASMQQVRSWFQIPRHVRFGRALEIDLQFGVINKVCSTDEPLALLFTQRVGDRHVYFTIFDVEAVSDRMMVQLGRVAIDRDGNGVEYTRRLKVTDHRDIDRSARRLIRAQSFALFRSYTRRVIFQGVHTGKIYPVYFKPGRIAGAEYVGRRQSLSAWLDKDEEDSRRLFSTIGRAVGALCLCGNRDFHAENLLITPSREGTVIDLECTGCPPLARGGRVSV